MLNKTVHLPYFDKLISSFNQNDEELKTAFNENVHWGYWIDPSKAVATAEDYSIAQKNLTLELLKSADIKEGFRIIDVACGFGGTISLLNENYSNLSIIGLNIDERQLQIARKNLKPKNGNKISFEKGDAINLPHEAEYFDLISTVEAIFHFRHRDLYFEEVKRVLKPGGQFIMTDFVSSESFPIKRYFVWKNQKRSYFGDFDLRFTIKMYKELAAKVGLKFSMERDITPNTLPTYFYLTRHAKEMTDNDTFSIFQIKVLEFISKRRWLNYYLMKFEKPSI
ncbi:MAG: methyltransferase domain-containing protein [Melioribacteraceae bacterium]|nr:methyltransferase domain-containing protein [Melioribacteraceae bacterium]MCF8265377.1 methyltransferase domain-containing protein [Melioribacteraceae bacterium]MCF8412283.1 methyltransferase domain-containing protein [Melioribacteraceae bacterium]